MASRNMMIGTGAALAGLGGLAAAAVTVQRPDTPPAQPTAQPVETRTVVVRTVEHRVKRVKVRHRPPAAQAATIPAAAPAPAPVVQAAPVAVATPAPAPTPSTAPIRTRTSGSSASGDERESGHGGGSDDRGESQDD